MPNYTFVCRKCQKKFSLSATFEEYDKKDPKKFSCPKCGSTDLEQDISNVFFVRGSGTGGVAGCGPVCGPGTC